MVIASPESHWKKVCRLYVRLPLLGSILKADKELTQSPGTRLGGKGDADAEAADVYIRDTK